MKKAHLLAVIAVCFGVVGCVPVVGNTTGGYSATGGVEIAPYDRYLGSLDCVVLSGGSVVSTASSNWTLRGSGLRVVEFELEGGGYEDSFLSLDLQDGMAVHIDPKIHVVEWKKSYPPKPGTTILQFTLPVVAYAAATRMALFVRTDRLLIAHTVRLRAYGWIDNRGEKHIEFPRGASVTLDPEAECFAGGSVTKASTKKGDATKSLSESLNELRDGSSASPCKSDQPRIIKGEPCLDAAFDRQLEGGDQLTKELDQFFEDRSSPDYHDVVMARMFRDRFPSYKASAVKLGQVWTSGDEKEFEGMLFEYAKYNLQEVKSLLEGCIKSGIPAVDACVSANAPIYEF